ncbi:MAG: F0F1 ATP synthase subunit B [Gemmatimonadales bacterium]
MPLPALLLLQEHGAPAPGGQEAAHVATPFDINTGLIFWTLIVFGILLVLLWRFAWPSILNSVEERERRIQRQLEDAERANAEARRLLEEHQKAAASAKAEAQDLIAKAKAVVQKEREALLAKARAEYEALLARARKDVEAEKNKALVELRREAVELSIAAASKVIEANLDTDANRRLVADYLASLEQQ